jgi:hypothetical protein
MRRVINAPVKWSTDESTYTDSGDLAATALYSEPMSLEHLDVYNFQFELTGATVTGVLKLQASNTDPFVPPESGIPDATVMLWTDITGLTYTATVAANPMINASDVGYRWVRAVWTETPAAAGTVTARFNGKGPN